MRYRANAIDKRRGANLPHWTSEGATYSVTFRLADSLPAHAVERLRAELAVLESNTEVQPQGTHVKDHARIAHLRDESVEGLLNENHGECILRNEEAAEIVANALRHFDGNRYTLHAWCVMPNHVHVVFRPHQGFNLTGILHSWKSFTAHAINKLLGRSGGVWQQESYDHMIRDQTDLEHHINYVRNNPVKAGLKDWKWVG
jgi:REP element-mobilizing transposase RayT